MNKAKDLLKKHLGPAAMEDAINRLAGLIKNGELLAATDPAGLLNAASDLLESGERATTVFACRKCGAAHNITCRNDSIEDISPVETPRRELFRR